MVRGPTATVTVTQGAQVVSSITMIPNGPFTLQIPADQPSVLQHFTGSVLDQNGIGIQGVTLYAFQSGTQILSFPSTAGGNFGFDVTFNAVSPPGTPYLIDVSNNTNNT